MKLINLDSSATLIWVLWKCLTYCIPLTSINGLYNITTCQWSFQFITDLITCFLFLFVNLGRSQMSLSKLGKEVNQIKWYWAYQSSGLFEGPCWLPEHVSSFIFSQFTWWINIPAECLAPIFHLHKFKVKYSKPTFTARQPSVLMLWQPPPMTALQGGLIHIQALFDCLHTYLQCNVNCLL